MGGGNTSQCAILVVATANFRPFKWNGHTNQHLGCHSVLGLKVYGLYVLSTG